MKKSFFFLLSFFFISFSNAFAQSHNSVEVELERIKKDIIDLQKYVYKNNVNFEDQSKNSNDLEEINFLLSSISEKLVSLENQINDMKEDISNLYLIYTSPKFQDKAFSEPSEELNIEESSSKIVSEKSNDNQILGQMTLSNLEEEILPENEHNENEVNKQDQDKVLGELTISTLDEQKIIITEPSEEQLATIADLDELLEQREIEMNKPKIDVVEQMQIAKLSLASLENKKAIESLMLIVESETKNHNVLADAYYLLGRIYYDMGEVKNSVIYFGKRHQDLSEIPHKRDENFFWLGKSLFSIGDQENGCLILEEIIFSDLFINNSKLIEDSKNLQEEKDCGFIY